MKTGLVHDQNLEKQMEKQMGCMTGFFQIFDRHQILSGKRLYATKRLPPSPEVDSTSQSEISIGSPAYSRELQQQSHQQQLPQPCNSPECSVTPAKVLSPLPELSVKAESPARSPLPFSVFEYKEGLRSTWKFKDAPRLSLDSRASFDGKGSLRPKEIRTNPAIFSAAQRDGSSQLTVPEDTDTHRRSPSVIARLMGLEALPDSDSAAETPSKAELRRSASESRVSRDILPHRLTEGKNFRQKQQQQPPLQPNSRSNLKRDNAAQENNKPDLFFRTSDPADFFIRKQKAEPPMPPSGGMSASSWRLQQQQRKSFFDSQDFFPEPKQRVSPYGEIEKRLKMRGIDEPAKDLEALKQILEALQLKGLLHSKGPAEQNFVYDRILYGEESPIVVMKPSRSRVPINRVGRTGTDSPTSSFNSRTVVRRNLNLVGETMPVPPHRLETDRILQKARNSRNDESGVKSPSSISRRKPSNIETQRRANDSVEQRRSSPVHSPRLITKKVGSEHATSRSPRRNRKPVPENSPKERISTPAEFESSTSSESSSMSSRVDTELQRTVMGDYNEGRNLLERCDKLLHSIAEITAASASELQPSPVSVLDSSFYNDESPSPIMKRCIDFKDQSIEQEEEENWSPVVSPVRLKPEDGDFLYVSEILQASEYLHEDSDMFLLLEKRRYNGSNDTRKESMLHRKLVFDTIQEILDRKKRLPPWKAVSEMNCKSGKPEMRQIWSEFQRIREREPAGEDLFEIICGVLRRDMGGGGDSNSAWGDSHSQVEISDVVLDIERLIFKDLVAETIRNLASFAGKNRALVPPPRRKLVF